MRLDRPASLAMAVAVTAFSVRHGHAAAGTTTLDGHGEQNAHALHADEHKGVQSGGGRGADMQSEVAGAAGPAELLQVDREVANLGEGPPTLDLSTVSADTLKGANTALQGRGARVHGMFGTDATNMTAAAAATVRPHVVGDMYKDGIRHRKLGTDESAFGVEALLYQAPRQLSVDSWAPYDITTSANGAFSVFAIDVDGDGDIDVLSASSYDDTIAWHESDGASPPSFTTRTITTSADDARSVFAIDVDGDGDIDVLSASYHDDTIAW